MFFTVSDFGDFLADLATQFPSKQAFAEAIGITPSRFSRVLAGTYTLNVLNCLRLAHAAGRSPSVVLRAAGKSAIADLIEALYGPSATTTSPNEREILDLWQALTPRAREALRLTMSELPRRTTKPPQHFGEGTAPSIKRRRKAG